MGFKEAMKLAALVIIAWLGALIVLISASTIIYRYIEISNIDFGAVGISVIGILMIVGSFAEYVRTYPYR